jgi:hypothetical protein
MGRGSRRTDDDGTVTLQQGHKVPGGRGASDIHSVVNKNATTKTGRPDGIGPIDDKPEDLQRNAYGYEPDDTVKAPKARGADVIATGENSESRAGFGRFNSVNHIVGEDEPPLTPVEDLIEQGGGV